MRSTGRRVYFINPMAVARYRQRHTVARKKSDHVDAMTSAKVQRTDAHAPRPLPDDTELARAITVLARPPRRHLEAHQGLQRAALAAARVLPHLPRRVRRPHHQPGRRRGPRRAGHRSHPDRRQTDAHTHRRGAALGRPPTRHRAALPGHAAPATASPAAGRTGNGRAGPRIPGRPGHRMRQRRPSRRGRR
ncbi:transposase [Actinomadura sp. NPDC048955]|uniref:IS110 family transposase n=1 Tax=Actinomadura sp. NPDC048955 TaxID=3158228 RepID=UPI00340608A2